MIYDRSFDPQGQLYYPNPPDEGAWAQEFLGDAMVVNGKVRPFLEVEPRKYRFRVVIRRIRDSSRSLSPTGRRSTWSGPTRACCRRLLGSSVS